MCNLSTKKSRRDFRVYVAGPIQGENLLVSLANLENGQRETARVFQLGFSPFPVFSDFLFLQRVRPIAAIQDIYNYSLTWLKTADVMIVLNGWEKSKGCIAEKRMADECGVHVVFDLNELCAWADAVLLSNNTIEQALRKGDD